MGNVNVSSEGAAQSASGGEAQPQDQDDIEAQEAEELTRLRRRIVDLLLPGGRLPFYSLTAAPRGCVARCAEQRRAAVQRLCLRRCGG